MTQQSTIGRPAIALTLASAEFETMYLRPRLQTVDGASASETDGPAFFRGLALAACASALFWVAVAVIA